MIEALETIPKHCEAGLAVMNAGKPLAALKGDASTILERLESESIAEIAASLKISQTALYAWLLQHCPEKWQAISSAIQLSKLTDCQNRFDDADCDGLETARTREKAKIAMWQLSKTSKLYADKQDANAGINIQVVIHRDEPAEVLLKKEAIDPE